MKGGTRYTDERRRAGSARGACVALLLAVSCAALALPAQAQRPKVIPSSGRLVTDTADMLTSQEERILEQKLIAYDDTTSTQIAVVTLPDLGGYDAMDYAITLGREWGIGQGGKDNGAVVLVSRDDRAIAIATGYGLEGAIPDAIADRIRRNIITPYFREGRFFDGLSEGVDALMASARGEFQAEERAPRQAHTPRSVDFASIFILLIIVYFFATSFGGGGGGGRSGGKRYRSRRFGGPPIIIWGGGGFGGHRGGGGGGFGGFGGGGGGFGGFGGGSFGGGGASGSW